MSDSTSPAPTGPSNLIDSAFEKADKIVKEHVLAASGIGFIPLPVFDVLLASGSNLYMIKRLCKVYDTPYKAGLARSIVSAVGSSLGAAGVTTGVALSMAKLAPGIATGSAMLAMSAANSAFTFALGRLFIANLESGNNLLKFDIKGYGTLVEDTYNNAKNKVFTETKQTPDTTVSVAEAT